MTRIFRLLLAALLPAHCARDVGVRPAAASRDTAAASFDGNAPLMPRTIVQLPLLVFVGLIAAASPANAQRRVTDLSQVSIEDLMSIEITSASRKEQPAADVAAATFVITHDDIRRSGMTTIPDLLRLAPGIDVAQINGNKWAVSVRGFNGLYANKLLLLIDGRSVYNRLFSGVLWDAEDLMLDDIDRIEVIRGPGAAMWGANAVNGVINIVTMRTSDTQGGLVRAEGGRAGKQGAVRYGGTLGAARYRLFAQWTGRDQSLIAPGTRAGDASDSVTTGFRADWAAQPGAFMLEGGFTSGRTHALWSNLDPETAAREPILSDRSDEQSGHVLGRWTHTRANGASLQIQSFLDVADRDEPVADYSRRAFDVDTQYHTALGAQHDLVAGARYHIIDERLDGHRGFSLIPAEDTSSLLTAFMQDDIALFGKRLVFTLGSQVQYDSLSGAGVQPTARVMWKARPRQRLWAATSRALRTPSLTDRGIRVQYPPVSDDSGLPLFVTIVGNPAARTENLADAEAGYRLEIGTGASIDVTGFAGRYDHLQTQEPSPPVVQLGPSPRVLVTAQFDNLLTATMRGLEIAGHWTPIPAWRLDGSYTAFHVAPRPAAASRDAAAGQEDGSAPRTQWQVRSTFSPGTRATLGLAIFHVGSLEQFRVAAYTRADITAEWRLTSRLSVMGIGQNLLDPSHAEFSGISSQLLATQVPRSGSLRLRWTF
jgi:iron complex outermembrane receptor protein